jgi:hypothetical protein
MEGAPMNMMPTRESEPTLNLISELRTNLMRAQIRLGMIARIARLNMEEPQRQQELAEVMQAILAACGPQDESRH